MTIFKVTVLICSMYLKNMLSREYLSNMFYDCIPGGGDDMFHVAEEYVILGIFIKHVL